jgi:hypothetical protein
MTCAHVLALIDAGPFADYPAAHLETAWAHARGCATCGPALSASATLGTDLARLPQPEPPAHLTAAVLARIARLDPPRPLRALATPAQAAVRVSSWQDRAAALTGVAAAGVVMLSVALGDGPALDVTSPRIGAVSGLLPLASTNTSWAVLAVSLVVYLIALFVPLRVAEPRRQ